MITYNEGKFAQALCTFRANTNDRNRHVSIQLDLTSQHMAGLSIPEWLELFERERLKLLANPLDWHLSYFQVLQRQGE